MDPSVSCTMREMQKVKSKKKQKVNENFINKFLSKARMVVKEHQDMPHGRKPVQENIVQDTDEITITINKKRIGKIVWLLIFLGLIVLFIAAYLGKLPGQGAEEDAASEDVEATAAAAQDEQEQPEEGSFLSSLISFLIPSKNDDELLEKPSQEEIDDSDKKEGSDDGANDDSVNTADEADTVNKSEVITGTESSDDEQAGSSENVTNGSSSASTQSLDETPLDKLQKDKIVLEITQIYTKVKGDDFGAVTKVDFNVTNNGAQTFEPRVVFYLYGADTSNLYSRSRFTFENMLISEGDELEMSIRLNANTDSIDKEKKVVIELTDKLGNVLKTASQKIMIK